MYLILLVFPWKLQKISNEDVIGNTSSAGFSTHPQDVLVVVVITGGIFHSDLGFANASQSADDLHWNTSSCPHWMERIIQMCQNLFPSCEERIAPIRNKPNWLRGQLRLLTMLRREVQSLHRIGGTQSQFNKAFVEECTQLSSIVGTRNGDATFPTAHIRKGCPYHIRHFLLRPVVVEALSPQLMIRKSSYRSRHIYTFLTYIARNDQYDQ